MQFYLVKNLTEQPIHKTWNKALLDEEDLERYEEFKETPEYKGIDHEDATIKSKQAEATRARPFFEQLGKGVRVRTTDARIEGRVPRYEWRFVIGSNIEVLLKKGLPSARRICDRHEIPYDRNDDVQALAAKIKEKFGSHEKILTSTQWLSSGLAQLERKEIEMKLRPGETKARIIKEGLLEATPMTELEVDEWYANQNKTAEDKLAKVQAEVKQVQDRIDGEAKAKQDLEGMTNAELKSILDERGVEYNSRAIKPELIRLIQDA